MNYHSNLILFLLLVLLSLSANGDVAVPLSESEQAVLSVKEKWDQGNSCVYAFRLHNTASFHISSVVPQFTALLKDNVVHATVFKEFFNIDPPDEQIRNVRFFKISCSEIYEVKVSFSNHCTMGSLEKISSTSEECGKLITVDKSTLVNLIKER